MNCIVEVNGRFLKRVLRNGAPLVTSNMKQARVMESFQATAMADDIMKKFGMKTAVYELTVNIRPMATKIPAGIDLEYGI